MVACAAALCETLGIPADEMLKGRKRRAALCSRLLAMGATAGTLRRILATTLGMGAELDGNGTPAMAAYIAHLAGTLCGTMHHAAPAPTSSPGDEGGDDPGGTLLPTQGDFKEAIQHARTMAEAAKPGQIPLEQRALLPQASALVFGDEQTTGLSALGPAAVIALTVFYTARGPFYHALRTEGHVGRRGFDGTPTFQITPVELGGQARPSTPTPWGASWALSLSAPPRWATSGRPPWHSATTSSRSETTRP